MCVVIVGGNDRMIYRYKDICREYGHEAKVFTQPKTNFECLIGDPDLIVLFTNPVSHGMAKIARKKATQMGISLAQSHSGSCDALRNILNSYGK